MPTAGAPLRLLTSVCGGCGCGSSARAPCRSGRRVVSGRPEASGADGPPHTKHSTVHRHRQTPLKKSGLEAISSPQSESLQVGLGRVSSLALTARCVHLDLDRTQSDDKDAKAKVETMVASLAIQAHRRPCSSASLFPHIFMFMYRGSRHRRRRRGCRGSTLIRIPHSAFPQGSSCCPAFPVSRLLLLLLRFLSSSQFTLAHPSRAATARASRPVNLLYTGSLTTSGNAFSEQESLLPYDGITQVLEMKGGEVGSPFSLINAHFSSR